MRCARRSDAASGEGHTRHPAGGPALPPRRRHDACVCDDGARVAQAAPPSDTSNPTQSHTDLSHPPKHNTPLMRRTLLLALALVATAVALASAQDEQVKFIPAPPGARATLIPRPAIVTVGRRGLPTPAVVDAAPEAAEDDDAGEEAAGDAAPAPAAGGTSFQQLVGGGAAPAPGAAMPAGMPAGAAGMPAGAALPPGVALPPGASMPAGVAPPPGVEFMPNGAIKKPLTPPPKISLAEQLKKPGVIIALLAVIAAVGGLIVGAGLAIHHRWFKKERLRTPGSTPTAAAGAAAAALLGGGSSAGTES